MAPIYCLMKTGAMMTPGMCNLFYEAARTLVLSGGDCADLKNEFSQGRVTATGKSGLLEGISGPIFEGVLEWDGGQVRASFIVRGRDFPSAEEVRWSTSRPDGTFVPLEHIVN